jgi:CubicO group peptidase (beta-lactamase class C family)
MMLATLLLFASAPPSPVQLEAAERYFLDTRGQALVVLHAGKPILERYANGGSHGRMQPLASGTKSFVGIAAAAAVDDGLLTWDQKAADTLPEWRGHPRKSRIEVRQILSLTSGLAPGEHGVSGQLPGWAQAAAAEAIALPGTSFAYGPNNFLVFGHLLETKLAPESFEAYLRRRILDPLGVKVEFGRCEDGRPNIAGGARMTARDWATLGEWVQRGGEWNGTALVRPESLEPLFHGTSANPAYGLTWWLVRPVPPRQLLRIPVLRRELGSVVNDPRLPRDIAIAAGLGKQRLYVIPSRRLVVVRLGPLSGADFDDGEFLSRLLK